MTESNVPAEYEGLCWFEIVEAIEEEYREAEAARRAQEEIPHRWQ